MIIKWAIVLLAGLTWQFALVNPSSQSKENHCEINNVSFKGGEKLAYKAYYNWGFIWIPAGEASFSVKESADYYEVLIQGSSYKTYDGFFKLRDRFYTKVNKRTLLPVTFEREVNEGDYKKYERIEFDQKNFKATAYTGETKDQVVKSHHSFNTCMHDLVSLLYFMRNIDVSNYQVGDSIPTTIFFDKEVFKVNVRYKGKELNKSIKGKGKFNTVKVVPDLIEGTVFNKGDQMNVWVTDDFNKMPLLVESPLKVGSLKAVLKTYSGLRHGLISKK